MSTALAPTERWEGNINTQLGAPSAAMAGSAVEIWVVRNRIGAGWARLAYLPTSLGPLTGMTYPNQVLPDLLKVVEGSPDISTGDEDPLVKDVRSAAAESRTEDASADGRPAVSLLSEELALKVAAKLVAAEHQPQSVGVTGEGRIAFGWSGASKAAMITVGDNGRVRISSKVGRDVETFGSWGVMEPIPGHYLELLRENF